MSTSFANNQNYKQLRKLSEEACKIV